MPRKKRKSLVPADPPKSSKVKHYCLQVIIALGFKIDNERAVQFRKWANQIVGDKGLSRPPLHERLRPLSAGIGSADQEAERNG